MLGKQLFYVQSDGRSDLPSRPYAVYLPRLINLSKRPLIPPYSIGRSAANRFDGDGGVFRSKTELEERLYNRSISRSRGYSGGKVDKGGFGGSRLEEGVVRRARN